MPEPTTRVTNRKLLATCSRHVGGGRTREPPSAGRICSDSTSLRGFSACDVRNRGDDSLSRSHRSLRVRVVRADHPRDDLPVGGASRLAGVGRRPGRAAAMPEWEEARAWGWIMASGEMTGTGARHAGNPRPGLIR